MNASWLIEITSTTLVLTPNSRLARFLFREHARIQTSTSYPTPHILPINRWLEQCYQDWLFTTELPLNLLSTNQELFIWESIIRRDEKNIFQPTQTAQSCMQAYEFLQQANLSLDTISAFGNVDVATFISWAIEFERYSQEHALIGKARLAPLINEAITKRQLTLPQEIYLASFDDFSPQIVLLLDTLKNNGVKITKQELQVTALSQQQLALVDTNEEINTMARWAKQIHDEQPTATITCIVPTLNNLRVQLVETFQTIFFDETEYEEWREGGDPVTTVYGVPQRRGSEQANLNREIFNISGGYSLAQAPIIKAALQFLHVNPYTIDCKNYTPLLTSPFIKGYETEYNARALFDSELRDTNEPVISWQFLLTKASQHPELTHLLEQVKQYLLLRKELPKKQTLAQWSELFLTLLGAIGWPGDQSLSSEEYQQMQRWYELLQELAILDLEQHTILYQTAISLLSHYTQKVLFQKETHDGPIQVLGLLEAAGLISDYVWVMGLDSETWPQSAEPNPFLPRELQRQHHMPHSSPERELIFAQQLMRRFAHSAKHIFYSYHQHDDGRELSPSPLLKDIPEKNTRGGALQNLGQVPFLLVKKVPQRGLHPEGDPALPLETTFDTKAPAFQSDEIPKGGSGIFKDQAACPFRAFAHYRLKAKAPNTPEIGLDPLERGSLLHGCLDGVWSALKTHERLCQIDSDALQKIISDSIAATFKDLFPYSRKLQPMFKQLEMQRLQQLILKWLTFEKQRAPFHVVVHEQVRRVQIGQLAIKLQIDRIDELADGQRVLLDYKTGKTNPAEWFGTRPRAPQLPLYAITEPNINALAFAQVRIDEMCFKGVSENDLEMKGINTAEKISDRYEAPATWHKLLEDWHATLEKLANDYHQGVADVDPQFANTCDDCDLHTLCRISERQENA